MSQISQEYNGVTTNARPCYSNLRTYGSDGQARPIIAPKPVSVQPALLNLFQPHPLPASMMPSIGDKSKHNCNCVYNTLGDSYRACNMKQ
jgi:hypothetical protein